jgi:uncharacterized membrane protein
MRTADVRNFRLPGLDRGVPGTSVYPSVAASGSVSSVASDLRARLVVYAFSGVYAIVFAAAASTSYLLYLEPRFDLGNVIQVVWSTAHGDFLQMSDPRGVVISRLGSHFDPFLALLVPLWWIWSSPLVLLGAQAVAVSSGALPVYWLGRKHLNNHGFAAVFAVAYLLYPATQFNAFTPIGVHAVSFSIPLILYAIWFLDEGRLLPFATFGVLAATTKEEIGAAVGCLGLWYAVRHGRRLVGAAIFALGTATSLVCMSVIIPRYSPYGVSPFAGRYENVGGTPGAIAKLLVTDPSAFVHQTATLHKLAFILLMLLPFLGLWALEPLMLVGALPDLAINLLSSKPEQSTVFYQYTAGMIPFIVVASILGAARLRRRRHAPTALLAVTACLAVVSPLVYSVASIHSRADSQTRATRSALKLIPPHAAVSASQTLGAYVSRRRVVAVFPNVSRANWVLVGPMATGEDDPAVFRRALKEVRSSPRWRTLFDSSGISVLERRG